MYCISYSGSFKKDYKLMVKRGYDMSLLAQVIELLRTTGTLPASYRPHKLTGKYSAYWECHIQNDWLLIWEQNNSELTLLFMYTGTHSDLFKK